MRYYEKRDPDFDAKMVPVLCVYKEVALLPEAGKDVSSMIAILSYDEKPGIQAISSTSPDLPPSLASIRVSRSRLSASQALRTFRTRSGNHSSCPTAERFHSWRQNCRSHWFQSLRRPGKGSCSLRPKEHQWCLPWCCRWCR